MPLFSEHIANMYYGSSSPYTGSPYSYSSSVSPIGTSYSASYLSPGGSYSNHSSIGGYSRAPVSSRWITSSGRNYSPMLSTISERGSASPIRINSPRRLPLSTRTYGTPNYTRPVNINTADIDVSKDKYRRKIEPYKSPVPHVPPPPPPQESSREESAQDPFMPRVAGALETGVNSSPGLERSTIKRGRAVVRLYTIKRKERDSPRKPAEEQQSLDDANNQKVSETEDEINKTDEKEFMKWREKLSDDLAYKDKKERKSLGAKLVEKFIVKDINDKSLDTSNHVHRLDTECSENLPTSSVQIMKPPGSKFLDRRCSMELMAEQANLLDSLIRKENLSTATLDLSKIGTIENENNLEKIEPPKRRKTDFLHNTIKTTKSDHSLHEALKSYQDVKDPGNVSKRRSIKKSSSGSNIRRLDSITELPKETSNLILPAIEESIPSLKKENIKPKPKTKLKPKITSSVEVSAPKSPLKFVVEKVTVEEKPRTQKKEIIYSSEVEELSVTGDNTLQNVTVGEKPRTPKKEIIYSSEVEELPVTISNTLEKLVAIEPNTDKKIITNINVEKELPSPEPENGNFWDKIGKRETVYLLKRKENLDETKEKYKRALFWFPEEEELDNSKHSKSNNIQMSNNSIEGTINKYDNTSTNKLTANAAKNVVSKDSNKEKVFSSDNLNTKIIENKLNENTKNEIVLSEKPIKDECTTEMTNDLFLPILDLVQSKLKDDPILEIIPEINNDSISKSTSPEVLKDHFKILNPIKMNSEKAKETLKTETNIEKSLVQTSDLHDNIKTKGKENHNIEQIPNVESKNVCLENAINVMRETHNNMSETEEMGKKLSNEIQNTSCPVHSKGFQKAKEHNIDATEIKLPCPVHPLGPEKIKPLGNSIANNNAVSQRNLSFSKLASASNDQQEKKHMDTSIISEKSNNSDVISKVIKAIDEPSSSSIKDNLKRYNKQSPTVVSSNTRSMENVTESPKISTTEEEILKCSNEQHESNDISMGKVNNDDYSNRNNIANSELSIINKNLEKLHKIPAVVNLSDNYTVNELSICNNNNKGDELRITFKDCLLPSAESQASSAETPTSHITLLQKTADLENSSVDSILVTTFDDPDKQVFIKSQHIPNEDTETRAKENLHDKEEIGEKNKAENITQKQEKIVTLEKIIDSPSEVVIPKKPVKEEKAVRPLIATPRPLQKKAPQIIHSSDSSDTSSEEESSEEDEDSGSSEGSGEFYECENNPDGRTSTGSNDSGFDSSAPASPATFSQIKKDCDVNCHRKCEKLTANLCGVNQRLLVEALASRTTSRKGGEASATTSSSGPAQCNNTDILEQELEQSTAYDIFRKTGRFTPPARSIPRFRKYTIEDFQFIKVLGKGSFGKVLLAELRDTEYYYAVKCLKKDVVLEDDDVECTLIERKVLALGTNHPYLCHLFATFQTDSHLFFVMEYLNGGDLMFHIQQSGRFPEARARLYAAEIVSGLKFLHKRGIVYRDLKLDNILLDYEGHVRIADFGMCKLQIYLDKTADTFCGTPDYMAPEIIKGLKYNQTVDWWSFGVLLYEMLIGQSPFSGCDEDELFWSICNEMPSYPRFLSQDALTILTRLLDKDARTRLGGTECMHGDIRDQEFFHAIHWDRLERRDLEAPFRPRVRHPMDTQYFDRAFTGERPRLTAVEPQVLRSMDQEPFKGFSYTNPNTTDR